jgi:hypothetical protein
MMGKRKSNIKFIPDKKQKSVDVYSIAGEWKCATLSLCGEKPPVAIVVME